MADPSLDDLKDWCEQILHDGRGVTAWELDFIEKMAQKLDFGQRMTEAQVEKIEQIYADRTRL